MSIIQGTAKPTSADDSFYDFPIDQSLRFDGSSYLSRTPSSASNRKTFTWSAWLKRVLGTYHDFFSVGSGNTSSARTDWHFRSDHKINISFNATGSSWDEIITSQVFRDSSAWYHLVVAVDTTQATSSNRVKLYVNGSQVTDFSSPSYPNQNTDLPINSALEHNIGRYQAGAGGYFEGYMAEINFIDGTALTPTSFGEFKNGVWIPKDPSGLSYGTNGFRLKFALSDFNTSGSAITDPHGSSTNLPDGHVADASGSGNHWNVN